MKTLFEHLKTLFDCELYSNAITLSNLLLSIYETNRAILSAQEHFSTLVYYAESLYHERRFREAETIYRQALQVKRVLSRNKVGLLVPVDVDLQSEVELKYKTAKCLIEMKCYRDAIVLLQSLAFKQRTPKVNMLLSKLCHNHGHERSAIGTYKEVLKECPLAFEAIEGLLALGIKGIEVNSLIVDASLAPQCSDWMSGWIKAHANIHARKYPEAIQALRSIEANTSLRNYHQLLVLIGECYYHNGDYEQAYNTLKRAHAMQPHSPNGIQMLAILMAKNKKISELEKLVTPTPSLLNEYTSEMWFVMGQYLFATAKYEKAVYFVQKACFLNSRNVEALILKAEILFQAKKYQQGIAHLRYGQQFAPYRYEFHKALVDNYLNVGRVREAQMQAMKAVKMLGESARTLVLLARTYIKDENARPKAKALCIKALGMNENFLPAVYILAELYQRENDLAARLKLLKKHAGMTQNCKLHIMLGEMLNNEKDHNGAMDHYTMALNLDPLNRSAIAGLLAVGQSNGSTSGTSNAAGTSSAYLESIVEEGSDVPDNPLDMIEIRTTGGPNELESESDAMWSDVEIEINQ
ncbi:anaphase-promoting complex subunit 7 [Anopheles ziemanni]|uniref:anaphase-promoting complex subunit 7 n=1 Tax=Anopheles coustani TaxID=139045 RepID=UPI00265AF73F|nr:anaphase-promoting complex subunit 7 [Anopheles coustani]XP_058172340.1 anaphase-promoting complex subunit 7 [Anopheles ziemanni]